MRHVLSGAGLVVLALMVSQACGVMVTLQQPVSGPTIVSDTEISSYGGTTGTESYYNYGGSPDASDLFSSMRYLLVQFNLSAIPNVSQVTGVTSATLEVYRNSYSFNNGNLQVAQLAENWVAGTGNGQWNGNCDGAQWYARTAGTTVPAGSLINDGDGTYSINGVTNLASDPAVAGNYFVRMAGSPGNFNNAGQSGLYTAYPSLAALQAAGSTRGYFYDSANSRLYVNKNDSDVRWYSSSDLWTTPGGTVTGSTLNDMSYPVAPAAPGWVKFDITSFAQNWLLNGQANDGVRIGQPDSCQNEIFTSEYATDPTLRPELVLNLTYAPEPATLLVFVFGGIATLIRRRR